jgi:parallel beta-helix repeat protein
LSANIGICSGNGLVIGASHITFNCAGYAIIGNGSATGAGINLTGISRVTVENCSVTGFQYGIALSGSSNDTLTDNTANYNGKGFEVKTNGIHLSSSNTFTGNTADNNVKDGFEFYGSSSNNTLTGNTANNDGIFGFSLTATYNTTFTGNTADSNYHSGFRLGPLAVDNTLSGNIANNNNQYGYWDYTTGSGTGGTANFYTGDECSGNGAGGSSPSGLGTPQS